MRTLVYKRTHTGDPNEMGEFGCRNCMGSVRSWPFEAVIGVGGIGAEPDLCGIAYKLTWIGVGAHKLNSDKWAAPIVVFDHFRLFDKDGPDFREKAPALADRIYSKHVRTAMAFTDVEAKEIARLLRWAKKWPPSLALTQLSTSFEPQSQCRTNSNPRAKRKRIRCNVMA